MSSDKATSATDSTLLCLASWLQSVRLVKVLVIIYSEISTVYNYKDGDYFGEIALVRNIPRQASVKALTFTKIVSIERSAFKRVLGPI